MSLKHKFILKFAIGFSLGMLLCNIITAVMTTSSLSDGTTYFCDPSFIKMIGNNTILAFVIQSIISGLYGGICVGGTVLYDKDDWSILKATCTHFVITFTTFYLTACFLRWFTPSIKTNIIIFIIMVLVYILIWIIQYIIYKIEIKKINKDIKKLHKNK